MPCGFSGREGGESAGPARMNARGPATGRFPGPAKRPLREHGAAGGPFRQVAASSHGNDAAHRRLGRLARPDATHSAPGTPDLSRSASFTYNAKHLLASEAAQPGSPLALVTERSRTAPWATRRPPNARSKPCLFTLLATGLVLGGGSGQRHKGKRPKIRFRKRSRRPSTTGRWTGAGASRQRTRRPSRFSAFWTRSRMASRLRRAAAAGTTLSLSEGDALRILRATPCPFSPRPRSTRTPVALPTRHNPMASAMLTPDGFKVEAYRCIWESTGGSGPSTSAHTAAAGPWQSLTLSALLWKPMTMRSIWI